MLPRKYPPLTLKEYERIFRVIHAVIKNENTDLTKSCLLFNVIGAFIASQHHQLKSVRPMAGFAGYNTKTSTDLVLLFGSLNGGTPSSTEDAFHCWIEVDGWIIDFTAPLFDLMAPPDRKGEPIPPLMFQKPARPELTDINDLNIGGHYLHIPNTVVTDALIDHFKKQTLYMDLLNICNAWYKKPPKKIDPTMTIANQHNEQTKICLSNIRVQGAW